MRKDELKGAAPRAKSTRPQRPARWPAPGAKPADELERTVERMAMGYGVWEEKVITEEDGKAVKDKEEQDGKNGKREKHERTLKFVPPDYKMVMALMRVRETGTWGGDASEARPKGNLITRVPKPGGGFYGGDGLGSGLGGGLGGDSEGGSPGTGSEGGDDDGEG